MDSAAGKKPVAEPKGNNNSEAVQLTPAVREDVKDVQLEKGSDQVIQPKVQRRKIPSLDEINSEDFEFGVYGGMLSTEDFGVNPVAGIRLAYNITEYVFMDLAAAASKTSESSYERLSGGAKLLTTKERILTYYEVSAGLNLFPGESFIGKDQAFNTTFYVIGGVGITHFAGDDQFTVSYGAGYRFFAKDWLAAHFDVRDHIFELDLLGVKKITNNLEMQVGISIFY